ncbi:hypothetical protein QOT17_008282 [Balamuthia mandrillaris]
MRPRMHSNGTLFFLKKKQRQHTYCHHTHMHSIENRCPQPQNHITPSLTSLSLCFLLVPTFFLFVDIYPNIVIVTEMQQEEEQYLRPERVLDNFGLADEDVLNIYLYGSRVYGTHSAESDWDYIVLLRREVGLLTKQAEEEEAQQHGKAEEQEAGNKDASSQQQVSSLKELEAACDGKLTIQGKDLVSDATLITLSNFQRLLDAHYPPILGWLFSVPVLSLFFPSSPP